MQLAVARPDLSTCRPRHPSTRRNARSQPEPSVRSTNSSVLKSSRIPVSGQPGVNPRAPWQQHSLFGVRAPVPASRHCTRSPATARPYAPNRRLKWRFSRASEQRMAVNGAFDSRGNPVENPIATFRRFPNVDGECRRSANEWLPAVVRARSAMDADGSFPRTARADL